MTASSDNVEAKERRWRSEILHFKLYFEVAIHSVRKWSVESDVCREVARIFAVVRGV